VILLIIYRRLDAIVTKSLTVQRTLALGASTPEMEDSKRAGLTETSNALRGELKIWEKAFSAANDGKKASREDIKKNVEIGMSPYYRDLTFSNHVPQLQNTKNTTRSETFSLARYHYPHQQHHAKPLKSENMKSLLLTKSRNGSRSQGHPRKAYYNHGRSTHMIPRQ